tara:strand:+ start:1393 stop:2196 length:804 start_codon:yes stop_codon:yes gene_type:complete
MKTIKLKKVEHNVKIGDKCPYYEPTITEDCLLEDEGEIIGFYIKDVSKYNDRLSKLLSVSNNEFRSDNVPKSEMLRSESLRDGYEKYGKYKLDNPVLQYSTILGSLAPRALLRRTYPSRSSVHSDKKAQTFIKAMLATAMESEKVIKEVAPTIYERQMKMFESIDDKWKFGNMFTSSISNFNIAAAFHRDTGNLVGSVNVILTKRNNSKGGSLNVPDYNTTFEQADNSMLVYPAWRNMHGVTPIKPIHETGYRNSLIFYSLKYFKDK